MDSSGSPDAPAGGLLGFVLQAVAPLVAGAAVLEVTEPPARLVPPAFWSPADTPRRHRREAPGTPLGEELFDVALLRVGPLGLRDDRLVRPLASALRPDATLLMLDTAAVPRAELASVLAVAGLREVCAVRAAGVPGVTADAGTVHVLRAGAVDGTGARPAGPGAAGLVRDAGLACLVAAGVAAARVRAELAELREESGIEITKLTTTLDARTVSLTRRVERADRNARRWEQRYDQLRNRPALRAAAAVEEAVNRLRHRAGAGS